VLAEKGTHKPVKTEYRLIREGLAGPQIFGRWPRPKSPRRRPCRSRSRIAPAEPVAEAAEAVEVLEDDGAPAVAGFGRRIA